MTYFTEARKHQVDRIRKARRRKKKIKRLAGLLVLILLSVCAVKGIWSVVQIVTADRIQEETEAAAGAQNSSLNVQYEQSQSSGEQKELSQAEKLSAILADDTYPEPLKEMAEKNSETVDFVYNYPELKGQVRTADLTEESRAEQVPLLLQWDERWGYGAYNGSVLGNTGCGPTSLSMVILYLTNDATASPTEVAAYAERAGYCVSGSGSSWTLISEGCEHYGLRAEEVAMMENRIKAKLDEGCPVIANVGPGDFTDEGHYLVIVGYDSEGFIINDPNSRANSEKRWTFDQLNGQVRNLWAMSCEN